MSDGSALSTPPPRSAALLAISLWGVGGVVALLAQATIRLTPLALEPIERGLLTPPLVVLYGVWVLGNLYAEGYRAFQLRFSPRVVARALHLAENPRLLDVLLAPLFCMGFFHARRRTQLLAWGTTAMVISFIALLRYVPQPWRGIIDGGVVLPLAWGALAIVVFYVRALAGHPVPASGDFPEEHAPKVAPGDATLPEQAH